MVLPIVKGKDEKILRTPTKQVKTVTKELVKLLKNMEETVVASQGLGIAAPQVNETMRVCIVQIGERLMPLINPEITWKSEDVSIAEEGCLSLPGTWVDVPRANSIAIKYLDAKGQKQERELRDLDARVVQHEVDHLDGVLIVDYLKKKK